MRFLRLPHVAALLVAVMACSGYRLERQAQLSEQLGDWDQAVLQYLELVRQEPSRLSFRASLLRAKIQASHQHFARGKQYLQAGVLERAVVELQEAVQLDPTNQYAFVELQKVRDLLEAERQEYDRATSLDTLKEQTQGALPLPPVLNPRSDEPIDLDFPEPVSVKSIYQALGRAFGINVVFDAKMRDQEISIQLKEVTAQDALEHLMRAAGHFYKVLDEHTIIVVPDTTQNRRAYTDQIIQTFYLSNSDVGDVMTLLRTLIESRKLAPNERLNAVTLRDSPAKVKIAERLIQANDKAGAEVVVDVELMQIDTSKLREIGLSLDPRQIGFALDSGGATDGSAGPGRGTIRFSELEFLNASNWFVTIPDFLINFIKDKTEAQTLARPQLRISEGETATFVVADQVPIPVTRFNTANTVGSNIVPVTSFQYQDVGITIEITPRVHHNNEVSLKVNVEVSNIAGSVGDQPIIGTREISTTIRLKDGETNFLAGLIRTDESVSEEGVAGLSELPLLGRLFSKKRSSTKRTDIILTLTPHIIRRADVTLEDLQPMWVGTETQFSFGGGRPALESAVEGPFDTEDERERALERRRQRLQQLPQRLRGRSGEAPEEEVPTGVDLVPSSAPSPPPGAASPPGAAATDPPVLPFIGDSELSLPALAAPEEGQAFAAGAAATAAAEIEIALGPATIVVRPGDTFEVAIRIEAERPVSHLPMTVAFDPELLEIVDTTHGDFLGTEGRAQVLVDTGTPGHIVVGASRWGRSTGSSGRGELLKLRFRALALGECELSFVRYRALDALLQPIESVAARAGSVRVIAAAERPRTPRR